MSKRRYHHEITCADCNRLVTEAHPQQTKCVVCRLIANITWLGTSRKDRCANCKGRYARLKRNERLCGNCCKRDHYAPSAECAFCERIGEVYHKDIHVCQPCIYDARNREVLLRSLLNKQYEYRNPKTPELAAA